LFTLFAIEEISFANVGKYTSGTVILKDAAEKQAAILDQPHACPP
jgi:hypothetical protein